MKKTVLFIIVALVVFKLYQPSFSSYFFQDDWFSLRISQVNSFADFGKMFLPRSDVIYFRPIGMQLPYFLLQKLFGLNPLPFHLLTFITHLVNIFLVYYLVKLLTGKKFASLFSAFLYGTSLVHYTPFFWSATYAFVLGPTTYLITYICFLLFRRKKKKKYLLISVISFILGLLTNEMVAVVPVILFLQLLIFEKKKTLGSLVPFIFIGLAVFLVRFVIFPPPLTGSYHFGIGKHLLNNLEGYLLWTFNWPEEVKAQLVNFYTFNSQFLSEFPDYIRTFVFNSLACIIFLIVIPTIVIIRQKKFKLFSYAIFGILWFLVALSPVIFFSEHSFSYYLSIPLIGLLIPTGLFLDNFLRSIPKKYSVITVLIILIVCGSWVFSTKMGVDFNDQIHWAPRRARTSKSLVEKALKNYHFPDDEYIIYVRPVSELKLSLNDQDAFKLIFQDSRIETRYMYLIKGDKVL